MSTENETKQPMIFSVDLADDMSGTTIKQTAQPAGQPVHTAGWDVVNALSEDLLNTQWLSVQASQTNFDLSLGTSFSANGAIGKIGVHDNGSTGLQGSGENIYLNVPVLSGSLTINGDTTDIAPGNLVIQAGFTYNPPVLKNGKITTSGTQHTLSLVLPDHTHPTAVIDYEYTGSKTMDATALAFFKTGLAIWLQDQGQTGKLPQLDCATVTVNNKLTSKAFSWMPLTDASYAYEGSDANGPGAIAILGMTQNNTAPGPFHSLSADVIPKSSTSAGLLSQQIFARNILYPAAPPIFKGSSQADFVLQNNDTAVSLAPSSSLSFGPVEVDGTTYDLTVTDFSMTLEDRTLITFIEAKTEIAAGITLYVDVTTHNGLELVEKSDGTHTIGYKEVRPVIKNHRIHNSTGAIIAHELIVVILAAFFGIAGAVQEKIGEKIVILIIASIIKGIVSVAYAIVPDVLAKGIAAAMPSIDELIEAFDGSVSWAGQKKSKFTVTDFRLNGAVQFSGTRQVASLLGDVLLNQGNSTPLVVAVATFQAHEGCHNKLSAAHDIINNIKSDALMTSHCTATMDGNNKLLLNIRAADSEHFGSWIEQAGEQIGELSKSAILLNLTIYGALPADAKMKLAPFHPVYQPISKYCD